MVNNRRFLRITANASLAVNFGNSVLNAGNILAANF